MIAYQQQGSSKGVTPYQRDTNAGRTPVARRLLPVRARSLQGGYPAKGGDTRR